MTIEELSLRCANRVLDCMPAIDMSHRERIEIRTHATEEVRSVITPEIESRDAEIERLLEGWNADVQWRDKLIAENQRLNEDKTRLLKNDDAREEYLRLVGESHGRLARQVRELEQENQRLKEEQSQIRQFCANVAAYKFANPEGKTVLDFMRLWLDQSEDSRKSLEQQVAALRRIVDRDHAGLTGACSAHLEPDLACETCYPDLNALLLEHVERSREIADERDAARQQVAELRRDAERYRWLRKFADLSQVLTFWHEIGCAETADELDAAIDAALKQETGK